MALICWNLLQASWVSNMMEATMSKELSSTRTLPHFQPHVHSHLIPLYHTTVLWSILYDGRTWQDSGGSSWLLHWPDVVMIPEGKTFKSKKRALPKPITYSIQSEGLTKSSHIHSEGLTKLPHSYYTVGCLTRVPHSWALWRSLPQS